MATPQIEMACESCPLLLPLPNFPRCRCISPRNCAADISAVDNGVDISRGLELIAKHATWFLAAGVFGGIVADLGRRALLLGWKR